MSELNDIARALVAPGKGILAADESDSTIKKRFDSIGVESTEDNRRAYRDLLFTTPGAEEYISGVILFDETIRQQALDGTPFPKLLERRGSSPGSRSTRARKPLANAPGETVTEGLDGLRERLEEYRGLGARFAKWRAVISIGDGIPSEYAIWVNAHALARYAALCAGGRARPDRGARGADGRRPHDRAELRGHVADAARGLHRAARPARRPGGILLKPNMVLSGYACPRAGVARRGRRAHAAVLPPARAGRRAGDRVPVGRPDRTRTRRRTSTR